MYGQRRGRIRAAIAAAVAVVGVGSGVVVSPPASAYDSGTCLNAQRAKVDQFTVETGGSGDVDFGDDMHLWGAPQGTAVVCWGSGGSNVYLKGKLFWDSPYPGCADAEVDIYDRSGVNRSGTDYPEICSNGGLASRVIEHSLWSNRSDLSHVRLRLYRRDLQSDRTRVITVRRYF